MINTAQLQIGNLIYLDWKVIVVTADIIVDAAGPNGMRYQPIPIDDKVLIRLGFKQKTLNGFTIPFLETNELLLLKNQDEFQVLLRSNKSQYLDTKRYLLYVHEIQNLYRTLSGSDLNSFGHLRVLL